MCHTFFQWNVLVFGTEPYLHINAMNGTAPDFFCRLWGIHKFSHEKEVAKLKTWLKNRFTYLDGVINAYPEKQY